MAPDYGGRAHLPLSLRNGIYEGYPDEYNQCPIIHWRAELNGMRKGGPNRFPLRARVISLASELRIIEYNREEAASEGHWR